jgi:hypothetical protein
LYLSNTSGCSRRAILCLLLFREEGVSELRSVTVFSVTSTRKAFPSYMVNIIGVYELCASGKDYCVCSH